LVKIDALEMLGTIDHLCHISEDSSNTAGKSQNIRGSNVLVKPVTRIFSILSHPDNYLNICHHANLKAQT